MVVGPRVIQPALQTLGREADGVDGTLDVMMVRLDMLMTRGGIEPARILNGDQQESNARGSCGSRLAESNARSNLGSRGEMHINCAWHFMKRRLL